MSPWKKTQIALTFVSCIGFVLPSSALAATPTRLTSDVAVNGAGELIGSVTDAKGNVVANTNVLLRQSGAVAAETRTNANGAFAFGGLRGGVYQVQTAGTTKSLRLWASRTAPPSAAKGVLIVAKDQIVRGQCCTGTTECVESCTMESGGCSGGGCGEGGCSTAVGCTEIGGGCGCSGGGCGVGGCGGHGGCFGGGGNGGIFPWLVVGGAVAAVAIPLAIDDDDVPPGTATDTDSAS